MKKHLTLTTILSIGFAINSYSQTTNNSLPSTVRKIETSENTQSSPIDKKVERKAPAKEITVVESEPTFPKYIDTGNPEQDQSNYAARKAEWIKNNPEAYERMQFKRELTPSERKELELKSKQK